MFATLTGDMNSFLLMKKEKRLVVGLAFNKHTIKATVSCAY